MNKSPTVSVVVTNFNGLKLIKKSLPLIVKNSPEAIEIIFSDDASTDQSVLYVKKLQKLFPIIKIISHLQNQGFGKNSNFAAQKAKGELIVFLNSDIYPHPGYISAAIGHFKDKNVFGVGFAEHHHENWGRIFWKEGTLQYEPGYPVNKTHITAWLSGGSSIIRKQAFLRMGGFDNIYAPFYSEDLDLGFRAWKSGYTLLWEPNAIVDHKHEATISKFPRSFVDYVKERNRLLVVWRNITDKSLVYKNKLSLVYRTMFGPNYIKIIKAALQQVQKFPPPIVFPQKTDIEVFKLFDKHA